MSKSVNQRKMQSGKQTQLHKQKKQQETFKRSIWLWVILLVGLTIRLILAPIWKGYEPDVQTFMAWANMAYTDGLPHLYKTQAFLDYPPGYMYVLYLLATIRDGLGLAWDSSATLILFKLPAILADIATSFVLYRLARKYVSANASLGIAALYALNPMVFVNSAVWGQVDSIFMLVIAIYLYMLQKGKLQLSAVVLGLAILLKPQGLLFGPFLLIAVIQTRSWKVFIQTVLSGAALVIGLLLPFMSGSGITFVFKLYFSTLAQYNYASLNAFNLMTLLGGNFAALEGGGFSYQAWGVLLMIASLAYCMFAYANSSKKPGSALYFAFLFLAAVFTFGIKMHERYLFYALLPLLITWLFVRDRRILWLFAGFSLTHFVNVAYVLGQTWKGINFIPKWDVLMLIISAMNVGFVIYGVILGGKLFGVNRGLRSLLASNETVAETAAATSSPKGRLFKKKDWILTLGITVVYSVFALINLGSHQAPETFWRPHTTGSSLVFDLGKPATLNRVHTYIGSGHGDYEYAFSSDGVSWKDAYEVKSDHTKVFVWNVKELTQQARYVKLTVKQINTGFSVHEVAFFDGKSDKPLPVQSVKGEGLSSTDEGKPEFVIDEQDIVPYSPTYMDGTYFDEIYHARTAYEHIHKIEPYENTHPPLGKVFISAGIWLFGMNPFGWRIVGTLFGIAMIPIMYAFGKRLFGRSRYGFIAAFLFAFDFMHFAQTRIATIDVYGVFFIILMFYFMYRYMQMNFYRDKLWKTLIPLGLAGLFFGIGAASKWIVIYGGIGLAFLLLIVLIERYREHRKAKRVLESEAVWLAADKQAARSDDKQGDAQLIASESDHEKRLTDDERADLERAARSFWRPTLLTLGWCVIWYVIVPALIYIASYIPFMMVPGDGHGLKDVITYQKHMYDYHSKLVATHPFGSPWYEWPFMVMPIWYYSGQFLPTDKLSSIISFGNPVVWWGGFIALIATVYYTIKQRNKKLAFLLVCFGAQYLPWVGVPRLTFIYHYFATIPFLTLMLTYFIGRWTEQNKQRRWLAYGILALAFLLFLMFYPILSGMVIDKSYSSTWLRWLPTWNFF
ncbi:glycosyltransferase family 39 protein [Paenibacillus sp. N1-5-1-14]|uniref:glycosyltransferase family 39 protein n=1 Tax=Paenibacillus radicibacter TaxID=2972488 RepID=UPI0021596C22|nr:glycosyltransferase family 39 protein [Paenibacillus radicibacter]MCR8644883.1 glycosyltransferase family 39 protein [Paenibacillus radicibacter]